MSRWLFLLLAVSLPSFIAGCSSESGSTPTTPSSELSVGSWKLGDPGYESMQTAILEADVIIGIGKGSGIEWYDFSSHTWEQLNSIDLIRERLANVSDKSLISISAAPQASAAGRESADIQKIVAFGKELGFKTAVVVAAAEDVEEIALEITDVISLQD